MHLIDDGATHADDIVNAERSRPKEVDDLIRKVERIGPHQFVLELREHPAQKWLIGQLAECPPQALYDRIIGCLNKPQRQRVAQTFVLKRRRLDCRIEEILPKHASHTKRDVK